MYRSIIGSGSKKVKAGNRRAEKHYRRQRRRKANGRRDLRQICPASNLLRRLLEPVEAALRATIDKAKEQSWFPQLSMLSFFLAGFLFHMCCLGSLRDVVGKIGRMTHLKFGPVRRSTLSDAFNSRRRLRVTRGVLSHLVSQYKGELPKLRKLKDTSILDSSLFHLVPSAKWAKYRKKVNACKGHFEFELAAMIPSRLVITQGRTDDRKPLYLFLKNGWTYIVDRGYVDHGYFDFMCESGIYFVTRLRAGTLYQILETFKITRSQKRRGVIGDYMILLGSGPDRMQNPIRLVVYKDQETEKVFYFATNRFDLSPCTIADLYHARWTIELFFRWAKRTLQGEKLLGRGEAAVENHILITMILDILLKALARRVNPSLKPIKHVPTNFLRCVRDLLFEYWRPSILCKLRQALE